MGLVSTEAARAAAVPKAIARTIADIDRSPKVEQTSFVSSAKARVSMGSHAVGKQRERHNPIIVLSCYRHLAFS